MFSAVIRLFIYLFFAFGKIKGNSDGNKTAAYTQILKNEAKMLNLQAKHIFD